MRGPWRATVLGSQMAELLRRPGRCAATGLSLLMAAFVVFGAVMAQQIVTATVVDRFRGTPDAVSLVVTRKDAAGIGEAGLDAIRRTPGVTEAVGRADGGTPVGGSAAARYLALAADPGSGALAQVRAVEGAYPSGPRRLAVDTRAAEAYGLAPGSSLTLLLPAPDGEGTRRVPVEITGIVRSAATGAGEPTGYAPGPDLVRLLGMPGYSRVDVRTKTPAAATEAAERIRRAVPGAVVRSGDEVRDEEARAAVADASDTLELAGVFLAVAVGAAVLVSTSTFRIVFARRVRQLALRG
ncbi:hypothetical protein ABTX83_32520 [Streptomyces werraensis]|uniref:hypothetical protein n=1 Tax=Streptomyces werraensis TaxID=68284 RepID=UPI00331EA0C9